MMRIVYQYEHTFRHDHEENREDRRNEGEDRVGLYHWDLLGVSQTQEHPHSKRRCPEGKVERSPR